MSIYSTVKIFIILLVFISFTSNNIYSQRTLVISPKISADLAGNHASSVMGRDGDLNVNTGVSIGLEVIDSTSVFFNLGGGIMYLVPREQEISGTGMFNFIPVYALAKLNLTEKGSTVPSLMFSLGYNVIYNGDSDYRGPMSLSGGLYLGVGLRVSMTKVYFEGLYKSFAGSASYNNGMNSLDIDVTYTTFSLGFGLYF